MTNKIKKLIETISKQDILNIIKNNPYITFKEIAQQLGTTYKRVLFLRNYYKIPYKGNSAMKNKHKTPANKRQDFFTYVKESKSIQSRHLREKLIEDGLKEEKCESCGRTTWLGKKIPLEVHHKDGNKNNNDISNLEILCPNCHTFTDTYRGKNTKRHKDKKYK